MWFIGVEVERETSAPPPKKDPGSAPDHNEQYLMTVLLSSFNLNNHSIGFHPYTQTVEPPCAV